VAALSSFKIEDPQTVPQPEGEEPFLIRLPVRVRLSASLPQLMKVLGVIQRADPLIDVLAIRIAPVSLPAAGPEAPPVAAEPKAAPEHLEVELLLSRYLVTAQTQEPLGEEEEEAAAPASRQKRPTKPVKEAPGNE
jgi:hypothetical protein